MEPPVKRRRLGENPQFWDDEADEADEEDEEWEEYDGDDDVRNGEALHEQREGSLEQDDGYQLAIEKAYADNRFRATMAHIFKKYGRDFEGIGDEIDLSTGEIVVNNGHIENMRNEVDVGDVPGSHNGDVDEAEDDHYDRTLPKNFPGDESGHSQSRELKAVGSIDGDDNASQSWTSDVDETEPTPDNIQLQRLQQSFGLDSVDAITGYDPTVDGGRGLIPGLYGGGGLRYASALGEFGASPFALGPWDMLPQAQERYEFPKQDGSSSIWAPDYRFNDNEPEQRSSVRARLGLSRVKSRASKLKALPAPWTQSRERVADSGSNKRPGDAPRQHYDAPSNREHPMHLGSTSWLETMEESDTIDDAVFSAGEVPMSSDTGDTTDEVPLPKKNTASSAIPRVIPDSQDSHVSLNNEPAQINAKSKARQSIKPKSRDFSSACVLSDDESPLYAQPLSSNAITDPAKPSEALSSASAVPAPNVNPDGTVIKRGRGRPRKYPPGYRPPRNYRRKPKPPLSELPSLTRPLTVPTMPNIPFMGTMPTALTGQSLTQPMAPSRAQPKTQQTAQSTTHTSRTEAVPGLKRKRGRPRKYPLAGTTTQQQPRSPTREQTQQPTGQAPYLQPGIQQQGFQYPFYPWFQQPLFQFPQQMAYQPLQQSYNQHPLFQFQQQMVQQPVQLLGQPILPFRPAQSQSPSQPVKRKRGRPRKYPVKFDTVYPGYVMNRKRNTPKYMYEGLPSHPQLPGLQNSMTALLSGQSGRMMVSEDAWYGVARQLAQDIACLQGGSLYNSQFQTEPPVSTKETPRSSSEKAELPGADPYIPQRTEDEPLRITELPEVSDIEAVPSANHECRIDNTVSLLHDVAVTEHEYVDSSSIEGNMIDPMLDGSPQIEFDMFDDASLGPPPFDSGMIYTDSIDPALSEQAPMEASEAISAATELASDMIEPDTFDTALVDPALMMEDPDLQMEEDDAGFVIMPSSPRSVTEVVHTTPSPSPPRSIKNSLPVEETEPPVEGTERCTRISAQALHANSHTLVPLESIEGSSPMRHEPDHFDLPSSPESVDNRVALSVVPRKEPVAEPEELAEHLVSPTRKDAFDLDGSNEETPSSACEGITATAPSRESPPTATMTLDPTKKKPIASEQDLAKENEESSASAVDHVQAPPSIIDCGQTLIKEPRTPERIDVQPPKLIERHRDNEVAPVPRTELPADAVPRPRTPEPPKTVKTAFQTPKTSSEQRPSTVLRSAGRCTPNFVESPLFVQSPTPSPPKKKEHTVERRTMGELKKAILEPRQKATVPKPVFHKVKPKLIETETGGSSVTTKLRRKLPDVPVLYLSKSAKMNRPHVPKPAVAKTPTPQDKASTSMKKPHSRRSLLSLVSGNGSSQDLDEEFDELGTSTRSDSSSSTKLSKPLIPTDSYRDKPPKKTSASATDTQTKSSKKKSERDEPRETIPKIQGKRREEAKAKKKKRRHTDGSRSKSTSTSVGSKECGVDGYNCNRDFCFTCL
ncbi:Myb-like DNA-binding domain protein [Metarhizium rileyi]|uniref:Myb-like DNA-binding domain protein n=1 Tax=Metarhizium rileyi (strain RCEF 4871) TaxID=1649241 RepID=A0A162JT37_METRR|nr:Myb-like DNA-binding domain protein [Metarhizium rileyi RCEF 4871]